MSRSPVPLHTSTSTKEGTVPFLLNVCFKTVANAAGVCFQPGV